MKDTYANNTRIIHPSEVLTTMNEYVCTCIGAAVYEKQVKQYQTMLRGKRTVKLSLPHDQFRRLKTVADASKIPSEMSHVDHSLVRGINNNGSAGGSASVEQALPMSPYPGA